MDEIWKDVSGYEGLYQVSNFGKVRSVDRLVNHIKKSYSRREVVLTATPETRGYMQVTLCNNKHRKTFKVHRLVATSFIDNKHNKPTINHIDGIKSNNRVDNLEWSTISENVRHAFSTGLNSALRGESNNNSKLRDIDIIYIRLVHANSDIKITDTARVFNVSTTLISKIITKKIWNHI